MWIKFVLADLSLDLMLACRPYRCFWLVTYHHEKTLHHFKICDEAELVARRASDIKEFARPLEVTQTINRLISADSNNRAQRENTEIESNETRSRVVVHISGTVCPESFALWHEVTFIQDGMDVMEGGKEALHETSALRIVVSPIKVFIYAIAVGSSGCGTEGGIVQTRNELSTVFIILLSLACTSDVG